MHSCFHWNSDRLQVALDLLEKHQKYHISGLLVKYSVLLSKADLFKVTV